MNKNKLENYLSNIPKDSKQPKSVLMFIEFLDSLDPEYKKVESLLELGCGDHAALAHWGLYNGINLVHASDISESCINTLLKHGDKRIHYIQSDLFEHIIDRYDLVLFNPPQMPMPYQRRKQLVNSHDSVCDTGKSVILRTIKEAINYTKEGSKIIMMIFDFLLSDGEIFDYAKKLGFTTSILKSHIKDVRKGGKTEESLEWIKTIYPNYIFNKNSKGEKNIKLNYVLFQRP